MTFPPNFSGTGLPKTCTTPQHTAIYQGGQVIQKIFCCGKLKSAPCLTLRKQTIRTGCHHPLVVVLPLLSACSRAVAKGSRGIGIWFFLIADQLELRVVKVFLTLLPTHQRKCLALAVASLCHKLRGPVLGTRSSGCVGPSHQLGWGKIDIPEVLQLRRQGIFSGQLVDC